MKYGICYCYWSKDWQGNDYPHYIERARACGFDILEIPYGRILTMPEAEKNEIMAACRANDVELYITGGFGADCDLSSFEEAERKNAVKHALFVLEKLQAIGARNFSGINYAPWNCFDKAREKDRAMEASAKSLREIGQACAAYDFSWNMEVVNRYETYMLNTAEEAVKLADMIDHPNINILLDTFHCMMEENDMVEAIRIAGKDRLGHYHMGANNRRLPQPGFIPWQDIANTLTEIGYDKSVSFEPLVRTGGTVAYEGGNVWRDLVDPKASDAEADRLLRQSREYIQGLFENARKNAEPGKA